MTPFKSRAEKLCRELDISFKYIPTLAAAFAALAAEARLAALEEASILAERLIDDGWFEIGPEIRALKEKT